MKIYLAPMEGITTFVYRNAFSRYYGGIDKYFTPFVSSKNLNFKELNDVAPEHNRGLFVVPQILTNHAETFLSIAEQLQGLGYREINLNLGCPSGTVVAKGRGAGFLGDPHKLDGFLAEIYRECPLDISIKTRIGIEDTTEWDTLLAIYAKHPIHELIIHPRLQKEFYTGIPHFGAFAKAQNTLTCPLCYNGDITSPEALGQIQKHFRATDSIMLGRGAIAAPTLPGILQDTGADTSGSANIECSDRNTFRAFHEEILTGYMQLMSGDQPVLFRMKELWTYMRLFVNLTDKELKAIRKTKKMSEYQSLIHSLI